MKVAKCAPRTTAHNAPTSEDGNIDTRSAAGFRERFPYTGVFPDRNGSPQQSAATQILPCQSPCSILSNVDLYDQSFRPAVQQIVVESASLLDEAGLEIPESLELTVGREESSYNEEKIEIAAWQIDKDESPTKRDLLVAFLHEYGHPVFRKNFASRTGERIEENMSDVAEKGFWPTIQFLMDSVREKRAPDLRSKALDRIENAIGTPGRTSWFRLTSAYTELFSDTLAVLQLNDGAAVRWTDGDSRRDFTLDHRRNEVTSSEVHVVLAPTRSVIWEMHKKYPALRSGHILRALFDAICSEATRRQQSGQLALPPRELNDRLIAAFQREMEPYVAPHLGQRACDSEGPMSRNP